jgi:hypothetical protein
MTIYDRNVLESGIFEKPEERQKLCSLGRIGEQQQQLLTFQKLITDVFKEIIPIQMQANAIPA